MLRFFFWILLIINAALAAAFFGVFDHFFADFSQEKHEPERLKQEKNPERMQILSASSAQAILDAQVKKAQAPIACWEAGNFNAADSKVFEDRLKSLALASRQTRAEIAEVATNMVYLPSFGSKDAADKKVVQLKKLGIEDMYVVQDQSPLKWGISLGVFKTPDAAKAYLASLVKKGLKEARIAPRAVSAAKMVYRFQNITPEEKAAIEQARANFASVETHECKMKAEEPLAK